MSGQFTAETIGDGSGHPVAEDGFAFDAESAAEIDRAVAKYPPGKQASAVLPLLYIAQRQMGRQTGSAWISTQAMNAVAHRLEMPPIRVYEVATFYLMFNTRPIGRFHVQVCTTTPCWLRGSDEVVAACRRVTGISGWAETSADGLFTMTEVECLGACVNAPILQINDDFYEDVDGAITEELLGRIKQGQALPRPGSMVGRQNSAPAGGATTLTPAGGTTTLTPAGGTNILTDNADAG
jgi:NADH-quinone oxidoreductase E subunit